MNRDLANWPLRPPAVAFGSLWRPQLNAGTLDTDDVSWTSTVVPEEVGSSVDSDEEKALAERQRQWVTEAKTSDLGLWWIADDVRETLRSTTSETEVRERTLASLRSLLERGDLRAVTLTANGGYLSWPGAAEEIIGEIRAKWSNLNTPPDIGDIVWFIGQRGLP